jgi:hypothetical protein
MVGLLLLIERSESNTVQSPAFHRAARASKLAECKEVPARVARNPEVARRVSGPVVASGS